MPSSSAFNDYLHWLKVRHSRDANYLDLIRLIELLHHEMIERDQQHVDQPVASSSPKTTEPRCPE